MNTSHLTPFRSKFSVLASLLKKEFTQIRRNAFLPRLIVVFPVMIMCVMPWVMNMEVKNIVVDVVDHDRSTLSQRLVHSIEHSNYFIFNGQKPTYADALHDIEQTKADIMLVIPQDYSKNLARGQQSQVLIAANAVNGTKGGIATAYLSQIVSNEMLGSATLLGKELKTSPAESSDKQFSHLTLYNKYQDFKLFMIPALFAIVMMLMTGFLPTLNIVGEKEKGTIEQINVTPVAKWAFILSKLIPYWLIALFIITVCLLLAWLVYGITPVGPVVLIYLLAMLLALFFSSFGLIISNYFDTMQQEILVMWFFVFIMLLLSGFFTPTRSMPVWAYATTYVNPVSYFVEAMRTVFIRGGHLSDIWHQLLALAAIGLFMAAWAVQSYKKNA